MRRLLLGSCFCLAAAAAAAEGDRREVGRASWYGQQQHGRTTASGERFDRDELTAAHPSLPMNSVVKVTNLQNGRSVLLRVNDRFPTRGGRVIDVSQRAAEALGMKRRGLANVTVEPVRR